MCPNAFSSKPRRRTAAAESPPPTTVKAWESRRAWATALVPSANSGCSKTPIGPFQKTVAASVIFEAYSLPDAGPMSRPIRSAGMASAATVVASAGALVFRSGNAGATTASTGRTSSTPVFSARSMYSRTAGIWSSWRRDAPTSWPLALRKVKAMPPPMRMRSALPSSWSMTASLSETLAPPSTTT